jgi:phosphocarrier protein FPr
MAEITLKIQHDSGLHARPLAQFVETVQGFDAAVEVTNVTRGKGPVNGASPVQLMLLAVLKGHEIRVAATGPEADAAVTALTDLVNRNFAPAPPDG